MNPPLDWPQEELSSRLSRLESRQAWVIGVGSALAFMFSFMVSVGLHVHGNYTSEIKQLRESLVDLGRSGILNSRDLENFSGRLGRIESELSSIREKMPARKELP